MWEPHEEGLLSLETTRHVSMITITLSTRELDTSSAGYQPSLPADQYLIALEDSLQDVTGKGCARGRGTGRGGMELLLLETIRRVEVEVSLVVVEAFMVVQYKIIATIMILAWVVVISLLEVKDVLGAEPPAMHNMVMVVLKTMAWVLWTSLHEAGEVVAGAALVVIVIIMTMAFIEAKVVVEVDLVVMLKMVVIIMTMGWLKGK